MEYVIWISNNTPLNENIILCRNLRLNLKMIYKMGTMGFVEINSEKRRMLATLS